MADDILRPEHGYAYVADDTDSGVQELANVAEVEHHPNKEEVCVTFEDGHFEYFETDFVEIE